MARKTASPQPETEAPPPPQPADLEDAWNEGHELGLELGVKYLSEYDNPKDALSRHLTEFRKQVKRDKDEGLEAAAQSRPDTPPAGKLQHIRVVGILPTEGGWAFFALDVTQGHLENCIVKVLPGDMRGIALDNCVTELQTWSEKVREGVMK